MDVKPDTTNGGDPVFDTRESESADFGFLPPSLVSQCRTLIESFHDMHGYSCLPDVLWKAGLGPFIETHGQLRHLLRKASTTRSAKKSNAGFAGIATTLLSLEILAGHFASWSSIYPRETAISKAILKSLARGRKNSLIEFYLYPPKYPNPAAIAALSLPLSRYDSDFYDTPVKEPDGGAEIRHLQVM